MTETYSPSEDSFLLKKVIMKKKWRPSEKVLDMGAGSGIHSETIISLGASPENLTIVDINSESFLHLKKKFPSSKVVLSDLFSKISGKFDMMIFNPPYLPDEKFDKEGDTYGGKNGGEVINKFLKQSKKFLKKKGKIYLLTSSHTKKINWQDYNKKLLEQEKLFFERLYVWELTNRY